MALQRKPVVAGTFGAIAESGSKEQKLEPAPSAPSSGTGFPPTSSDGVTTEEAKPIESTASTANSEAPDDPPTAQPGFNTEEPKTPTSSGVEQRKTESAKAKRHASVSSPRAVAKQPTMSRKNRKDEGRSAQPPSGGTAGDSWARKAVKNSHWSAKRRRKEWGPAPVRLAADVHSLLEQRRDKDLEERGEDLALIYYINAALESVPEDPELALRWAREYLDEQDLQAPASVGTTSRLHQDVRAKFKRLSSKMRTLGGFGYVGHLQNAAIKRLLAALDDDDLNPVDLDSP